ncbi:helix-turn-helix transcriptional regulator [Gulosibacter bifidus]|uniref:Helix-turn-helix transcriptional regulator n=1 Tax=Gulosibacter bifidus TaxID=272239 RepID=A0ABW5RGX3_9MICO|nr:WYL domain-containing protein [Gulosibacter bifidus]
MTPPNASILPAQEQRRWQLLIALQQAGRPLAANELFQLVPAYREYGEGRSDALEKAFERDRNTLKGQGIEVSVVPDPQAPDDRARWRYALAEHGVTHVRLSAEETMLVALASDIWLDQDLALDARRSYIKLMGMGQAGASAPAATPTLTLVTPPAFTALRDAIARSIAVRFDYSNQSESPARERHVAPLQLVQHGGRWLLNAWDLVRDAERNFILERITSTVTLLPSEPHTYRAVTNLPEVLGGLATQNPVSLLVRNGSDAAVRLGRRNQLVSSSVPDAGPTACETAPVDTNTDEWIPMVLHDWDHGMLADELAAFGTQVRVRAPQALRDRIRARLQTAMTLHTDEGAGDD